MRFLGREAEDCSLGRTLGSDSEKLSLLDYLVEEKAVSLFKDSFVLDTNLGWR